MAENNRLGKGLGAIFGDGISTVLDDIQQGKSSDFGGTKSIINIDEIRTNPYQPRHHFDDVGERAFAVTRVDTLG